LFSPNSTAPVVILSDQRIAPSGPEWKKFSLRLCEQENRADHSAARAARGGSGYDGGSHTWRGRSGLGRSVFIGWSNGVLRSGENVVVRHGGSISLPCAIFAALSFSQIASALVTVNGGEVFSRRGECWTARGITGIVTCDSGRGGVKRSCSGGNRGRVLELRSGVRPHSFRPWQHRLLLGLLALRGSLGIYI
jgi:hypothetical protein